MNRDGLIKNFFTSNIEYTDSVSFRRVIMVNSMLSLASLVFFGFAYFNYFLLGDIFISLLDFTAAVAATITLIRLRRNKDIKQASLFTMIIVIVFMISFIVTNENSHFGIIWSIFVPIFAIEFNGKKIGSIISILFYAIMFSLAYYGIGVWNDGAWDKVDLTRYIASSSFLTFILYIIESAHNEADKELSRTREREKSILEELKNQAITDGLTGMYNRRHFNTVVPKILATAQRQGTYISLFVLDVDFFKPYNDYYGHQKGDATLQKIAQELMAFVQREGDYVFRIGGEEFAGVIHTEDKIESEAWLSQLNARIVALNIPHERTKLAEKKVTASIGVCTTTVSAEHDMQYFYKRADDALYRAKESNRNTIIMTD